MHTSDMEFFRCFPISPRDRQWGIYVTGVGSTHVPPFTRSYPASNSLGMRLERIAPGDFQMGGDDAEFDERPVHRVTITRLFHIAETAVTNAQYERRRTHV